MLETVHQLNQLISAEVDAGIPADRIVLGGFSQGAAMSPHLSYGRSRRVAHSAEEIGASGCSFRHVHS